MKLSQRGKFPTASPMKHTVKLLPNYTAVVKLGNCGFNELLLQPTSVIFHLPSNFPIFIRLS